MLEVMEEIKDDVYAAEKRNRGTASAFPFFAYRCTAAATAEAVPLEPEQTEAENMPAAVAATPGPANAATTKPAALNPKDLPAVDLDVVDVTSVIDVNDAVKNIGVKRSTKGQR